jgi:amino acid transporter
MATAARIKKLVWSNSSDETVDASIVKETNAQIGDQVFVEGVPVYQDGNGAPVEQVSPLGYHVGWAGILFLNVSQMVGTGVFSTRECYLIARKKTMLTSHSAGSILRALDSVGLSILYWVFGFIISAGEWPYPSNLERRTYESAAGLAIFLEYASMFPNRSGGQVVYLEQAYPKPAFFFPVTYAFFIVAFSFTSSNAIVLARYIYRAAGYQASEWANKGLAMAAFTFLAAICLVSTRWSMRLMNIISAVKLIILLFIVITGFVVLGSGTSVKNPRQNFQNSFAGITNNGHDIANALVSINFAYDGYYNAFNVVNEIRVCS